MYILLSTLTAQNCHPDLNNFAPVIVQGLSLDSFAQNSDMSNHMASVHGGKNPTFGH